MMEKRQEYRKLKRILSFFDHETEEEAYHQAQKEIEKVNAIRIDHAHTGERLWCYHYEKLGLRIFLIAVLILALVLKSPPVVQKSHLLFSTSHLYFFLTAMAGVFVFKIYLAFRHSGLSRRSTKIRERAQIVHIQANGQPISFPRALLKEILKSYSMLPYAILLAYIAKYMLPDDLFQSWRFLFGDIENKQLGILPLIGLAMLIFNAINVIVLEKTHRSLIDRIVGIYAVQVSPTITRKEIIAFIEKRIDRR